MCPKKMGEYRPNWEKEGLRLPKQAPKNKDASIAEWNARKRKWPKPKVKPKVVTEGKMRDLKRDKVIKRGLANTLWRPERDDHQSHNLGNELS